jgi:CRISPR-associated protein Csb1
MTETEDWYERLARASSLDGDDAAIRFTARYEPIGGAGDKVSPPTYPVDSPEKSPYLIEERWDDSGAKVDVVLLDSRQAQANRCEEALQDEIDAGRIELPHLVLSTVAHGTPIRITSLEAPHRSRDAYFRDAEDTNGQPFDATEAGAALRAVRPEDAAPMYRHSPADLVYGVWDSHRDLRLATRFPRVYTSEMVGWDVVAGRRAAGRFDLVVSGGRKVLGGQENWEPGDGSKGTRLSKFGHGSIPPSEARGGGVVARRLTRAGSIGFAGLARVRFGELPEAAARAGRAVLATLALLGDRAAFGHPAVFLRSGCELVLAGETLAWVGRSGREHPFTLDLDGARELFAHAVARAEAEGLSWSASPVELRPQAKLRDLINEAYYSSPAEVD